ncbi:unnamed protein product [Ceratitis capitata]|uniref:(Mediterranean fruit fly) hypothetical protein n=1 Tax=Ceratitis capitata TaxID=7213 RepID=A0A811UDF5_CERCA|nr:unnamed protein product [Ceratitis capitata]
MGRGNKLIAEEHEGRPRYGIISYAYDVTVMNGEFLQMLGCKVSNSRVLRNESAKCLRANEPTSRLPLWNEGTFRQWFNEVSLESNIATCIGAYFVSTPCTVILSSKYFKNFHLFVGKLGLQQFASRIIWSAAALAECNRIVYCRSEDSGSNPSVVLKTKKLLKIN